MGRVFGYLGAAWSHGRIVLLAAMVGWLAGAAHADPRWDGPFAVIGLGLGHHGLALDQLGASVNGRPFPLADERADGPLVGLGTRAAMGRAVLGAEVEAQRGARAMGPRAPCAPGQGCARAGLVGRIGPTYRIRATLGREIAPGLLLWGGLGLSWADVAISHAYAQSASSQGGSGVITAAMSPFEVRDRAVGWHAGIGLEQRIAPRAGLRVDLVMDRLEVENGNRVFILTATRSGSRSATAQIAEAGNFRIDSATLRLSLLLRF